MQHAVHTLFLTLFITWLKVQDYGKKAADYCGPTEQLCISQLGKSKRHIYFCILFDMSQGDANSSAHPFIGTEWLWVPQTRQAGFHHPAAGVI